MWYTKEKILKGDDDMGTLAMIREEIFNDGKMLGVKEGFNDGKIIGIKEGFNNGMIAEKVASIKRLLHYKLKIALTSKHMELIDNASLDKLEEIERNIFEVTSWKEVEEILNG